VTHHACRWTTYVLVAVFVVFASSFVFSQSTNQPPANALYMDPSQPVDKRVDDLISRMTLEEKASQMVHAARAIPRLGVPAYNWWNEALHGVARSGYATVFPQAIGLAATWNTGLMHTVADTISTEARAKYHDAIRHGNHDIYYGLTFWSPNINIFRDPRWGRGQETYGEDPYLTSRLGVAFVEGMQGNDPKYFKVVATPKHYAVHSGPEQLRHIFNARVSLRDMEDTYLPAFRATVKEAHAESVMCAYNSVNGQPACANDFLLGKTLRGKWGFSGYVVSDCGAETDISENHLYAKTLEQGTALAIKAGTDIECGFDGNKEPEYAKIVRAVQQGLIPESDLDTAVRRLFTARFKLGMFDPPDMVPYARIPFSENDSEAHRKLALEAARQSMVLLKNDGTLPLKSDVKRIAVVGPLASSVDLLLGNYNGTPSRATTILQGIQKRFANAEITYAPGVFMPGQALTVPASALSASFKGEYFNNTELDGKPVLTRTDPAPLDIKFEKSPSPEIDFLTFSVRWTGELIPPVTGTYQLGMSSDDGFRLYLDDKLVVQDWRKRSAEPPTMKTVDLVAGRHYKLRIDYNQMGAGASAKLVWIPPTVFTDAVEAAKKADVVVAVLGIDANLEGEEMPVALDGFSGGDRTSLDMPKFEEDLLQALAATGKPVVLVMTSGSALSVNWAKQNIPAILQAWYPGEEGGTAVAEVLAGDVNPAGRLPVTFYKSVNDLPPFEDYSMQGRTYRYFKGETLFPFGYGLSYTKFEYSNMKLMPQHDGSVEVTADVKNTGNYDGDEVAQVYVTKESSRYPLPLRSLEGFNRVRLKQGETKKLRFVLKAEQLSVIDDKGDRVAEPGEFVISVGGGQPGMTAASTGFVQQKMNWAGVKK
jgi:beta-glucosidase